VELEAVAAHLQAQEIGDILEQILDPDRQVLRFALAGEMADLLDDGVGPHALRGDFLQSLAHLFRLGLAGVQPGETGFGVKRDEVSV